MNTPAIIVKDLHAGPIYLGSLVCVHTHLSFRGPWWRPTPLRALAKGSREARR